MFRFVVLHLLLLFLLRVAFYSVFSPGEAYASADLARAFWLGLRFDLRLILLLVLPLMIFGWGRWSPLASDLSLKLWRIFYTCLSFCWMLFYGFDFGFYSYLKSRMNSTVFIQLETPSIALQMVWESYPVILITLGFIAAVAFYYFLLQRFVLRRFKNNFLLMPAPTLITFFVVLFLGGLYGNFSQYPLRWSEAFFSPQPFLSHLSLNPVLYFVETYEYSNKKNYDESEVRSHYDVMASYLGVDAPNSKKLNFKRTVKAQDVPFRPNVVVIIMESMAMSKTNLMQASLKPTPYLEDIANQSHWFSQYYSPAEGTARNIFSIMTATPDVTKEQTSSRNPLVVDQKVIANAYKGYRKMYFLGGSASWANIRGIFSHNIEGVEIYEDSDGLKKPKTDVWGVSDLDLFIASHEKFETLPEDQPFFAVIQSASFHRPYTIPKDAKGFKTKKAKLIELKESGFYSEDQYNSLRFSDFSLGYFFKLAKKSKYYDNTIFVITGDHGLPDDGGANVSAGSQKWSLEKYHVPLIIHNKKLLPAGVMDERPAGHADLMTTAAYLAGVDHVNTTLGRNLFDKRFDKERYSFVYNYYSELGEFGLLDGEFYYHFDTLNQGRLFKYKSDDPATDVKAEFPAVFARMEAVAKGYLSTANYLLFNNQKSK